LQWLAVSSYGFFGHHSMEDQELMDLNSKEQ
jgi:hypothetical protein